MFSPLNVKPVCITKTTVWVFDVILWHLWQWQKPPDKTGGDCRGVWGAGWGWGVGVRRGKKEGGKERSRLC